MSPRQDVDRSVLVVAVGLTRFFFRSHRLYDVDSVNFALAIGRFDPAVHQPQPPGYFLYVCLGKLLNEFFHDPNAAFVLVSIAASCGAVVVTYTLADQWFGTRAARFAGLLFLVSPLAWFHGTVALTYIVEAFFSALIGYVCWRIYVGSEKWLVPGALILGFAAGVRPSTLQFLGPLFMFSVSSARDAGNAAGRREEPRFPRRSALGQFLSRIPLARVLGGLAALLIALLAWFLPMVYASGGPAAYFSSLSLLWRMSPGHQNASGSFLLLSIARLLLIGGLVVLCFGPASVLFARPLCTGPTKASRQKTFTWVWIAPALLFFTFVFFRVINSGYLLVIFPPLCIWLACWISEWWERTRLHNSFKAALAGLFAAVNIAVFLYAPLYCSYQSVRRFEAQLGRVEEALPRVGSRRSSLIVGLDSHFLGFRHAGYYFPQYVTVEYPEFKSPAGERAFTMQYRDTRLVGHLDTSGFTNFVLFPLPPEGAEYQRGLSELRAKFPAQDLHAVTVAGCEFITGPIADLALLLPVVASSPALVYTRRDGAFASVYRR